MSAMYYPNYLLDYSCKLGKCRRTCCARNEWSIVLSSEEYERARKTVACDARLDELAAWLVAPSGDTGEGGVAARPDGLCSFLSPEGTCTWHTLTGEDVCSDCREFPYLRLRVFDDEYAYPSGACEAVLESLLRGGEDVALRAGDAAGAPDEPGRPYQLAVTDANASRDSIYGAYREFVDLGLAVLQNRRYRLDERVVILVSCLNMVDTMLGMGATARLGATIQAMLEPRRIEPMLDGYARDTRGEDPVPRACGEMYLSCLSSEAYGEVARRVLDGMGLAAVKPNRYARPVLRTVDAARLDERKRLHADFLRQKEDFLAKVMASVYLHGMVPIANPSVWSCTKYFALCYALIKCGIMGYFDHTPTDEELVDLLVVLLRAFTHNEGLYRNALAWMDGVHLDDVRDVVKLSLNTSSPR